MNLTPVVRPWFARYNRAMNLASRRSSESQHATLMSLLREARSTEVGRSYGFASITSPEEYARRVPVIDYEDMRGDVERMVKGEPDLLWPGRCRRYAQSSGTSGGASKLIPLTSRSLSRCHYRGGTDVVASYLASCTDSRLFSGKGFILGGSYATSVPHPRDCRIGDLSASLIDCINPLANLVRIPSKKTALMADWSEKLPALVNATVGADVTNLSGVPSWFLTVVRRVMKAAGASELHEVWPSLEVFFHGGIAFGPYREQYDRLIDPSRMRYMETYNASEGFFALQNDLSDRSMLLLMDVDVYYEFIPLDRLDNPDGAAVPAEGVRAGETYALVITSSNGLWRYLIGDTVTVTSTDPLKIIIAGRTRSFINAFGEELMVHNADSALTEACRATGADVADYTAAPVYTTEGSKGHHQWLVEFNRMPDSPQKFAETLDRTLQQVNSDYRAKRGASIFLALPEIVILPQGTFQRYLSLTGRLGGQRKVPRLKNDRSVADAILRLIAAGPDSSTVTSPGVSPVASPENNSPDYIPPATKPPV